MRDGPAAGQRAFPNTILEMVRGLAKLESQAWEDWYRLYRGPLVTYLRYRLNLPEHRAVELFQDFVGNKVQRDFFSRWDPARGKFRNFLLTALIRYAIDELRGEPGWDPLEEEKLLEIADDPTEERVAGEWTRAVIAETLRRMLVEYQDSRKLAYWEVFELRTVIPLLTGAEPTPFDELIERYHFKSPQQAFNVLLDGKRKFKSFLKQVLAETEHQPGATESQVRLVKQFGERPKKRNRGKA